MSWNAISAVIGIGVANYVGRKRLMLVTNALITLSLVVMWYFMWKELQVPALIIISFFLLMFEMGVGSILWPYAAEICTDKGTALATVHTWFWTLMVGLLTPYMMNNWLPYGRTFLVFAVLSGAVSEIQSFNFILFACRERFISPFS